MKAVIIVSELSGRCEARVEEIIYQSGSLPVIDSTYNGKPTTKYGLTMKEAVDYLTELAPELKISIRKK